METVCEVCGESSPHGKVCDLCKQVCCPNCLYEADCCFVDAEDHKDDPTWAPPGWKVITVNGNLTEWQRIDT